MPHAIQCPKCKTAMEEGFVLDRNYARVEVSTWAKGAPAKGWFGASLRGVRQYPIQTYRCPACGYLESYAQERP